MITRSTVTAAIKITASVLCLVFMWRAFVPTNWSEVLKNLDPWSGIAAFLVLLVGQVANGYRHWVILLGLGRRLPARLVLALTSTGMFFNQVLPSGLGGDVIRVLNIRRRCGWARATASVLLDRVAGVSFNLALVACLIPVYSHLDIPPAAKIGIAICAIGPLIAIAVGTWLANWKRGRRLWPRVLRFAPYGLILLRRLARLRTVLLLSVPVAIGFFCFVSAFALLGVGLSAKVDVLGYTMMIPLIFIAAQFPLSFGGWGIREGAAAALMPLVGMDAGTAFLTSFLFGVLVLLSSLPGLLIWSIYGFDSPQQASAALATSQPS
jgi:uncharacterized membrane protein YbhN (UPF0104 family)